MTGCSTTPHSATRGPEPQVTEPDDRPGSDDPEDPSELMRLIGRTVPRSPHADTPQPPDEPASPEDQGADPADPGDREAPSGPEDGENARPDDEPDDRDAPSRPVGGENVHADSGSGGPGDRDARCGPGDGENAPVDSEPDGLGGREARIGPRDGVNVPVDSGPGGSGDREARSGPEHGENVPVDGEPVDLDDWEARIGPRDGENVRVDVGPGAPGNREAHSDPGAGKNVPLEPELGARGTRSRPGDDANVRIDDEPAADDPAAADEPAVDEPADPDALADDTELEHTLEALLLVVDSPIDEASLATTLNQTSSRVRQTLNRMSLAYTADARGIDLRRAGEGWRFYTRDRYAPYVEKLLLDGQRARLTRAALETLAVVAYRQPVTRARVSAVRGVNCDGVLRTLLTRGLVEEAGTEEQTGGTLFRTTELFLERLGLSTVAELPPLAPLLPDIDAIDDLES